MKRLIYMMLALIVISCGGSNAVKTVEPSDVVVSYDELLDRVVRVISDTTATPKDVTDAVLPFADRLLEMAKSSDKNKRIDASELSQAFLLDVVNKFDSLTKEESAMLSECLDVLGQVSEQWVALKGSDGKYTLTKEIVYVSYQGSYEPVKGVITIEVTPPTSLEEEPYIKVTFPPTAIASPSLMFDKCILPEGIKDDFDSLDEVEFDFFWEKGLFGEDIPMMAVGRSSILEKMFSNDILHIAFVSEDLSEWTPGGYEIARICLKSFKEEYVKYKYANNITCSGKII